MRFFRHVIHEYGCEERCGYHLPITIPALCPFYYLSAGIATIPLWLRSLFEPWNLSWYYLFCIYAGELLLFFASGFILTIPNMILTEKRTKQCKKCGAPMFPAGAHFDPKGSKYPQKSDFAIFSIFAVLNIIVWILVTLKIEFLSTI